MQEELEVHGGMRLEGDEDGAEPREGDVEEGSQPQQP